MEQRISLITLGVRDVAAARAFYQRLGWRASSIGGDEVAFFQAGGIIFGLYGLDDLAKDANLKPGTGFSGVALAYNVRDKADVDRILAEAKAAGATILKPGIDAVWGGYSGYFADPDGHPWEVAWNPGFPIAADGSIKAPD
jgi:catechol 2,3-dioxygenase-like lactoylglutathione lyase family enzyme